MKQFFVDKYRPTTLYGFVFKDEHTKQLIEKCVREKSIGNMILFGGSGCGKSTLAGILINALGVPDFDVLKVNASDKTGVSFIREELHPWLKLSTSAFGDDSNGLKVVVLEEADMLSTSAQKSLLDIMESTSEFARFIFTTNNANRLIPAIHSRTGGVIHIDSLDRDSAINLILDIVEEEDIQIENDEVFFSHFDTYFPDLRKIIHSIQYHLTDNNTLLPCSGVVFGGAGVEEWENAWSGKHMLELSDLLKLTEGIDQNNFERFYEVMYTNSSLFGSRQGDAVVLISQYLDRAQKSANQRLHLDAFLYQFFCME